MGELKLPARWPLWLGLNVSVEFFGLDCAPGLRARVEGEKYSGVRREKLLAHFSDLFLVFGRAHPEDTSVKFLSENI